MKKLRNCLTALLPLFSKASLALAWAALLGFALGVQAQDIVSVSAGHQTSFYLKSDGTIWAAGWNATGQLGNGNSTGGLNSMPASTPELIMTAASGVSTSGAGFHTLFLKADGTVWAAGDNGTAQLGDGSNQTQVSPVAVKTASGTPITGVKAISAGAWHSLFLKEDGTVWACGGNGRGQLGDGSTQNRNMAVQVVVNGVPMSGVQAISAGGSHSLFLKTDGTVWAVGDNWSGQLGDGVETYPDGNTYTTVPVQVMGGVKAIEAAGAYSLFLKMDGRVFAVGDNMSGQLGNGTTSDYWFPVRIPIQTQTGVAAISAREDHSLFLKTDGTIWGCGSNTGGELGDGTNISPRATPVQMYTYGAGISAISAGHWHSLYVQNGVALATGDNTSFALGDGTLEDRAYPRSSFAPVIRHKRVATSNSLGGGFSLKAESDGTVWGMGVVYGTVPSQVAGLSNILSVSHGFVRNTSWKTKRAVALDYSGKIWTWLTTDNITAPAELPGISDIVAISGTPSGAGYSLFALRKDHSVWGISWPNEQSAPLITQVRTALGSGGDGLNSVEQVANGDSAALALDSYGTVWAWGSNAYGQIGDGTTEDRMSAVPVLSGGACVAAGPTVSYAVKKDGTLWAWGSESYAVNGAVVVVVNSPYPVQIGGVADAVAIYSTFINRFVLKRDGRVLAWGTNNFGALGDNSTTTRTPPVFVKMNQNGAITDLTHVVEISASGQTTFFRREDGSIYACGWNNCGQIGGGVTTSKLVATLVTEF